TLFKVASLVLVILGVLGVSLAARQTNSRKAPLPLPYSAHGRTYRPERRRDQVCRVLRRLSADGADRAVVAEAQAHRLQEAALADQSRHQRGGKRRAQTDGDARRAGRGHRRGILSPPVPTRAL